MRQGRKSPRLKGFDYASSAAFFVTVCTYGRQHLFGEVVNEEMMLNENGVIVRTEWFWSEVVRPTLVMDAFVIMPNHVHGIVAITHDPGGVGTHSYASLHRPADDASRLKRAKRSLSTFVGQFKGMTTKNINIQRGTPGLEVWQDRYHDRIIRNERELQAIRTYIECNPAEWLTDKENV